MEKKDLSVLETQRTVYYNRPNNECFLKSKRLERTGRGWRAAGGERATKHNDVINRHKDLRRCHVSENGGTRIR